jgi:hypothetical protein
MPIRPVFPGTVPYFKEISRCHNVQLSRFLILQIHHLRHCNNAVCLYPTLLVSEFSGSYLRFCAYVDT